jgi:hypothetical protein
LLSKIGTKTRTALFPKPNARKIGSRESRKSAAILSNPDCRFFFQKSMDRQAKPKTVATPKVFQFSDIDHFRSCIRSLDVVFTPLVTKISAAIIPCAHAEQRVLTLPGCELVLSRTFPRILDVQSASMAIAFAMEDEAAPLFNGVSTDKPAVAFGEKGAWYSAVERATTTTALIFFKPNICNRGWPQARDQFRLFETTAARRQWLRALMLQIFSVSQTASM